MKKTKRLYKLFSILISMALLISCLPTFSLTASAEETSGYYTFIVENDEATITDVDESISGDIVIPSTLGGYTVTTIGYYAFSGCDSLTNITIPSSVVKIEGAPFEDCRSLESISVDKNNIVYHSKDNCLIETETNILVSGCKNSIIPSYVTNIGYGAFYGCWGLERITIPAGVKVIEMNAFSECTSLKSISIPNTVTEIQEYVFYNCSNLENISVDAENKAFHIDGNCLIKTSTNTLILGTKDSTIPDYVTSMMEAPFAGCVSLESIVIPQGVKYINTEAFTGCTSLRSITIPKNLIDVGWGAFYNCSALTDVWYHGSEEDRSKLDIDHILSSDDLNDDLISATWHYNTCVGEHTYSSNEDASCNNCEWTRKICVHVYDNDFDFDCNVCGATRDPECYTYTVENGEATITSVDKTISGNIVIPSTLGGYPVREIGYAAFRFCEEVTGVSLPDGLTSIGVDAFYKCNNLESITIPDSVTKIDKEAFGSCSALKSISLPSGLLEMGDKVFDKCSALKSVVIPYGLTCIGEAVFRDCTELTSVTIPDSVTKIGSWAFYNCSSLKDISLPSSLIYMGGYIFYGCTELTSITIPDGVPQIYGYSFYYCTGLKSITIPNSVTSIGPYAFFRCAGFTSFTIPNGVTSIGEEAFFGWDDLTSIILPKSVTSIGEKAFYDSSKLKDVWYSGSEEERENIDFGYNNIYLATATWHYGLCDAYYSEGGSESSKPPETAEHSYGDWFTEIEATTKNSGIRCKICTGCGNKITEEIPVVLSFAGASITLQNNLLIDYKVDKALFEEEGYTDPYVVFEIGGVKKTVREYTVSGDRYIFRFRNIAPNQINDTIYATLYATFDGKLCSSETKEYSIAEYCYNMLGKYPEDKYAKLRTLLVDLLNYGSQSQIYTGHNTSNLANKNLTAQQLSWATQTDVETESVLNTKHQTVENPLVKFKGAGLMLNNAITLRFKLQAESLNGLTVKIQSGSRAWTLDYRQMTKEDGFYYLYFNGLVAAEISDSVYLTAYKDGKAVSNTVCYSIESYVHEKKNSTDTNLANLVKAMMKYGKAAYKYMH